MMRALSLSRMERAKIRTYTPLERDTRVASHLRHRRVGHAKRKIRTLHFHPRIHHLPL